MRERRLGAGLSFGLGLKSRWTLRRKFRSLQKLAEPLCEMPYHIISPLIFALFNVTR